MPFKSKAQQRFMESKASPLTPAQKEEWEKATDFKSLPERASGQQARKGGDPAVKGKKGPMPPAKPGKGGKTSQLPRKGKKCC